MLNGIKNLINSKKAYMEATKLILENEELDDSIVLNEEPAEPEIKEDETIEVSTDEEPVEEPAEQPLPLPDEEEVPTNNDDNSDILTAEIDLTTNTQVDSLPIPPANASDAIVGDDFMNQAIDSGFGNEEEKPPVETTEDIMTEPVDDEAEKEAAEEAPMDEKKDLTDEDLMAMSLDEILDEMKDNKELNHEEESAHEDIMEDLVDDDKMEKDRESKEDEAKKVYESEDIMNMDINTEPFTEDRAWKNKMKELHDRYEKLNQKYKELDDLKKETHSRAVMDKLNNKMNEISRQTHDMADQFDKIREKGKVSYPNGNFPWIYDKPNYMGIKDDKYYKTSGIAPKSKGCNIVTGFEDDDTEKKPGFYLRAQKALHESAEAFEEFVMSEEFDTLFQEEISLGDSEPAADQTADTTADANTGEENSVTAAVKDKVEEISTEEPTEEPAEGTPAFASKEELMKKLSSVTKSLEDAKSLVMNVTK